MIPILVSMKAAIYHPPNYLVWRVEGTIHLPHCQAWAKKTQAQQTTTPTSAAPARSTPQQCVTPGSTALDMFERVSVLLL